MATATKIKPDGEIDFSQSVMSIISQLERPMLWKCAECGKGYVRPEPRAPFRCTECYSGQIINPATGH